MSDTQTQRRDPDKPWHTWSEVLATYETGCVVALPHDADRIDVGLAIRLTESGAENDPRPGDVEVRKTWGRLLSLRSQWEYEEVACFGRDVQGDPPEKWYPDDGTPAWTEVKAGEGDEIWVVEW